MKDEPLLPTPPLPDYVIPLLRKVEREMDAASGGKNMAFDPYDREKLMMMWFQREIERLRIEARRDAEEYIKRTLGYAQMFPVQPPHVAQVPAQARDPKPVSEESIVGIITGFRCWNAPLFEDILRSQRGTKWVPRQRFEAVCQASACTGEKCSCGIYAYKDMALVQSEYGSAKETRKNVYGQVCLWGRVLECERGYRAQFAYPKAFLDTGAVARRMAEVYGVPLMKEP